MTCKNCCYVAEAPLDPNNLGNRQMICRRYPPTTHPLPTHQGIMMMTVFPTVQPDMLCGECIPREHDLDPPDLKIKLS